jgi:hypothetical protein
MVRRLDLFVLTLVIFALGNASRIVERCVNSDVRVFVSERESQPMYAPAFSEQLARYPNLWLARRVEIGDPVDTFREIGVYVQFLGVALNQFLSTRRLEPVSLPVRKGH